MAKDYKPELHTVCVECGKPISLNEGCIWTKQRGYPPTFIHLKCYEKLLPKNRGKADGTPT